MRQGRNIIPKLLLASSLLTAITFAQPVSAGKDWERSRPETEGYSSKSLDALKVYLSTIDTTAMIAVHGGKVIFEYGDVTRQGFQLTSARKSLLALMYGKYVANGRINLESTLDDLGIDDVGGLLPSERRATVRHLITARSGVFHKNVNPNGGDSLWAAPPRGTQPPGSYFIYNNWARSRRGAQDDPGRARPTAAERGRPSVSRGAAAAYHRALRAFVPLTPRPYFSTPSLAVVNPRGDSK